MGRRRELYFVVDVVRLEMNSAVQYYWRLPPMTAQTHTKTAANLRDRINRKSA